jgi:hypothetical protein
MISLFTQPGTYNIIVPMQRESHVGNECVERSKSLFWQSEKKQIQHIFTYILRAFICMYMELPAAPSSNNFLSYLVILIIHWFEIIPKMWNTPQTNSWLFIIGHNHAPFVTSTHVMLVCI